MFHVEEPWISWCHVMLHRAVNDYWGWIFHERNDVDSRVTSIVGGTKKEQLGYSDDESTVLWRIKRQCCREVSASRFLDGNESVFMSGNGVLRL